MRRLMDIVIAGLALIVSAPVVGVLALLIWRQDGYSPFYRPARIGLHGRPFRLWKLRSMVADADKSRVDTTTADDPRITPLGHFVRATKLDEFPQFWNVLRGDMAVVGPRPNVDREVALYTEVERAILTAKPGITDLSSIVFSDLGEILTGVADANIAYNQLVRPWKSRLILFHIAHRSLAMDLRIIWLTAVAIRSSGAARAGVVRILEGAGAEPALIAVARRDAPLVPTPVPGGDIVTSRGI